MKLAAQGDEPCIKTVVSLHDGRPGLIECRPGQRENFLSESNRWKIGGREKRSGLKSSRSGKERGLIKKIEPSKGMAVLSPI